MFIKYLGVAGTDYHESLAALGRLVNDFIADIDRQNKKFYLAEYPTHVAANGKHYITVSVAIDGPYSEKPVPPPNRVISDPGDDFAMSSAVIAGR